MRVITADVTRREDVTRLRDDMSKHMPPVAGIVQGAMVLADGIFADMPFENMQKVLGPKMQGSRILDHVFSDAELDFFVMLSSVNAATGQAGQANYTAANMVRNFPDPSWLTRDSQSFSSWPDWPQTGGLGASRRQSSTLA